MDVKQDDSWRFEFMEILRELSKSQATLNDDSESKKKRSDFYLRLERLYYENKFRHYYSDILAVFTECQDVNSDGDINILGQNLKLLRQGYKPLNIGENGETIDISKNILKLYDHVNLEIARASASSVEALEIQAQKTKQLSEQIEKINENANEIKRKIDSSQKEYIAILGIFAAIVLAFTGGITFSTSVLENMHLSSIYRVVLVILLIGFTLVNILYLLFMFIDKLVRNNKRVIPISPLITFDMSVIAFVIIVIVLWATGFVETRNRDINKNISGIESDSIETIDTPNEGEISFESVSLE